MKPCSFAFCLYTTMATFSLLGESLSTLCVNVLAIFVLISLAAFKEAHKCFLFALFDLLDVKCKNKRSCM